jgi:hypothetical protein
MKTRILVVAMSMMFAGSASAVVPCLSNCDNTTAQQAQQQGQAQLQGQAQGQAQQATGVGIAGAAAGAAAGASAVNGPQTTLVNTSVTPRTESSASVLGSGNSSSTNKNENNAVALGGTGGSGMAVAVGNGGQGGVVYGVGGTGIGEGGSGGQGGAGGAGGQGGTGGTGGSVSDVKSTATGITGGVVGGQAAGGSAAITINEAAAPSTVTIKSAPSISVSASSAINNDLCVVTTGVGGSFIGGSVGLSFQTKDTDCVRRVNARQLFNMGYAKAAINLMAQDPDVMKALQDAGDVIPAVAVPEQPKQQIQTVGPFN